jgi:hypothetical protein
MCFRLGFIGKKTGAFKHYIYIVASPWYLCRVFLCIYFYFFTVYHNAVVGIGNILAKAALCAVVFQQMSQHFGAG